MLDFARPLQLPSHCPRCRAQQRGLSACGPFPAHPATGVPCSCRHSTYNNSSHTHTHQSLRAIHDGALLRSYPMYDATCSFVSTSHKPSEPRTMYSSSWCSACTITYGSAMTSRPNSVSPKALATARRPFTRATPLTYSTMPPLASIRRFSCSFEALWSVVSCVTCTPT